MSSSSSSSRSTGVGLPGIVLVIFVVLKLSGLIGWSWLWVLSPAWITAGIWVAVIAVLGLGALIAGSGRRR